MTGLLLQLTARTLGLIPVLRPRIVPMDGVGAWESEWEGARGAIAPLAPVEGMTISPVRTLLVNTVQSDGLLAGWARVPRRQIGVASAQAWGETDVNPAVVDATPELDHRARTVAEVSADHSVEDGRSLPSAVPAPRPTASVLPPKTEQPPRAEEINRAIAAPPPVASQVFDAGMPPDPLTVRTPAPPLAEAEIKVSSRPTGSPAMELPASLPSVQSVVRVSPSVVDIADRRPPQPDVKGGALPPGALPETQRRSPPSSPERSNLEPRSPRDPLNAAHPPVAQPDIISPVIARPTTPDLRATENRREQAIARPPNLPTNLPITVSVAATQPPSHPPLVQPLPVAPIPKETADRTDRSSSPAISPPVTIAITIGRIEVRGTPAVPTRPKSAPSRPTLSLQDYLNQRQQGEQ